jgi:predicted KAP-like P-loop ATPase
VSEQLKDSNQMRILTDEEEKDRPLYFGPLSTVLVKIIQGSYPRFTVGIFGDWGTGKTTLMKLIEEKLQENSIITVWFNAWRYEREEQFAIIPLLKTIAYAIPEDRPELKELKQKIKKAGINILKKIPDIIPSFAGQFFGEGAKNFTNEAIKSFKEEFIPKLELLTEVDRETIYYDGLDKIANELSRIIAKSENKSFRIVVFVDDLDRCSPKRALKVFESVKVFLDIEGFIFVLGLSLVTIAKLIEKEYEKANIQGRDYIRKIIQIPIFLPEWNADDMLRIIDNLINRLDQTYSELIRENKDILKTLVEPNPRELKRFVNNFMISYEWFSSSNPEIGKEELLLVQALQFRWDAFYQEFMSNIDFRSAIIRLTSYRVELHRLQNFLKGGGGEEIDNITRAVFK